MGTTKLEDLTDKQVEEQVKKPATVVRVERAKDQANEFKPFVLFLVLAGLLHFIGAQWPEVLGAFLAVNGKSLLTLTVRQAPAPTQKKV